ncbi:hypothetical protein R3P38DRAFT_3240430 [Favolaschia claudopus]|uniref:F-box domain-containing protein n=1 Tax=Favolaschia claudopus TaxID=2862362 RepID=A0AAV9Z750_9AGAR
MPVEVLAHILLTACGVFAARPRTFLLYRSAFMQVCTTWRAVVCGDTRFWSGVFIGDCRILSVLDLWISRSLSVPLHLFVDTGSYAVDSGSFTRIWCSFLDLVPVVLDRVSRISLLDKHGDRGALILRCLSNMAASRAVRLDICTTSCTEIDARVLERGRWGRYSETSRTLTPVHLLPSAALAFLTVRHTFVILNPCMLSGLHSLWLGPIPCGVRLSWVSLRDMLMACSVLELLTCDDVQCEYGLFEQCDLPSLLQLHFVSRHWSAEYMFAALRLPSLQVLSLGGCASFVSESIAGRPCQELASVKRLALQHEEYSAVDFVDILRPFVNVKALDLRQMHPSSVSAFVGIKKALRSVGVQLTGRLCPSLESVLLAVALSEIDVLDVLSASSPTIFSSRCSLSWDCSAAWDREGVLGVKGTYCVVDGSVVSSPYYAVEGSGAHVAHEDPFAS